jgi:hypothetical protein
VLRGVGGDLIAEQPQSAEATDSGVVTIPLNYGGLTHTGRALLVALAPQVAVVSHATAMNTQLDDARRHLIGAAAGRTGQFAARSAATRARDPGLGQS